LLAFWHVAGMITDDKTATQAILQTAALGLWRAGRQDARLGQCAGMTPDAVPERQ